MPPGDAGLERNHGPLCLARAEQDRLRTERDELRAEVERLREHVAEWESAHSVTAELRDLIESHMDMARGQWRCVAQRAAQQAVVDAARWIEEDGWTPATRGALMNALVQLPAESAQAAQPEGEQVR